MNPAVVLAQLPLHWANGPLRWAIQWWIALQLSAQMLVLMLSPSSYRASQRPLIYHHLVSATLPALPGFVMLSAALSLVIIRIVVVTAGTYGLSQYALDLLVRTLVVELLPLLVALFVALRYTMPGGEEVAVLRQQRHLHALWRAGGDPARDVLLPRVVAGVFAVVLFAALSGFLALILTYVTIYGFTSWGFAGYTRAVGHVFTPAAALILAFKAFFFSLAVAILPISPHARVGGDNEVRDRDDIGQLGRLFALVLLIEVLSLFGNYY